jgi:mannose-6-phosphate isomerase-like protein (cupin superfamily)
MTSTDDVARPGWERVSETHEQGVVFKSAGEGEFPSPGAPEDTINILVDGSHTRGLLAFLEYEIGPKGTGPGLHWHRGYDENFYVVSGSLGTKAAGVERILKPRDFVFVPRGVIHTFFNPSETEACRFVSCWTPPGAEQIFPLAHEALARGAAPEELLKLAEQVDVDVVFVETPQLR